MGISRISGGALWALALSLTPALCAESQWASAKFEDAVFQARLVRGQERIQAIVGDDLDRDFILVEMKVRPLYGTKLSFDRDEFLMRCRFDNETSTAQSPGLIAGSAVLVLGESRRAKRKVFQEKQNDPQLGRMPGIPGPADAFGSGGGRQSELSVSSERVDSGTLVERLERLELPLEENDDDIHGYLYFQVNPKRKLKHIELSYEGRFGKFLLKFKK